MTSSVNAHTQTHTPSSNIPKNEALKVLFQPRTLGGLGLLGTHTVAGVKYEHTTLPRRGKDAWLAKLPKVKNTPISMDIDLACVLFDHTKTPIDALWYGKLRTADDTIRHAGDSLVGWEQFEESLINQEEIRLRTAALDARIHHIVFVISSHHNQPLNKANKGVATLADNETSIAHSFELSILPKNCQALIAWHLQKINRAAQFSSSGAPAEFDSNDEWLLHAPLSPITAKSSKDKHIDALTHAASEYIQAFGVRF
ncbi:hypothetical protein B0181_02970 [Moraxella caviae]|uniref:Uncharacterized proteins involved in stress response, homologs of TerZ and putative cAMP-binding protein CABP1 n=1 Tax=Moraxella caviae TaxID=34060 RepID=A0A1T0A6W3_9GAMM|nr:TerD family protein [Moraxella caviae]OOR91532.1 hypothetical protein B0181_02970 [Moraxella caviae]STZ14382.1 Uncharacterized proteins involved in stress response, homologs of TerZ and putative cAMP-binding protein CABP1 [Moraxella caviae]VEW10532.1 Uncharacterized proteins involved in stress response, homologs of TerZ and putative cAMP-binding protein CABP1 [Moraxella caviae]